MRSLLMIVVVTAAGAGCPSRKPAEAPPPSAPSVIAPATPPVPVSPPPARTELDRSHGFFNGAPEPELIDGAYVWPCPLADHPYATLSVTRKGQLSLSNGGRRLSGLKLDDDFYAADTEVICAKGFVTLHREKDGRYREAGFAWDKKRLAKTARSEGLVPPVRGP